jgi:hypothetical protein
MEADYNVRMRVREPAITVRKQSPSEAQQTPQEHVGLGISSNLYTVMQICGSMVTA